MNCRLLHIILNYHFLLMNSLNSSGITHFKSNPKTRLRLFCFPYAGGSAFIFRNWQDYLPATIQICPIEFPGHSSRLMENPLDDVDVLVRTISSEIKPWLDLPFAFFGHSLGALVSFELAHFLRREYARFPSHLIVSGRQAPPIPERSPKYALVEADLIAELSRLGGTPKDILENAEMLELLLPTIRADLKMDETYHYQALEPLECPITVFGGLQDPETTSEDLTAWQEQTKNSFSLKMFSGNHFFIDTARQSLLEQISQALLPLATTI